MEVVLSWKQNKTKQKTSQSKAENPETKHLSMSKDQPTSRRNRGQLFPIQWLPLHQHLTAVWGAIHSAGVLKLNTLLPVVYCMHWSIYNRWISLTLNLCLCCIQILHTAEDVLSNVTHWQVISSQWKLLWKIKCYFCKIWLARLLDT